MTQATPQTAAGKFPVGLAVAAAIVTGLGPLAAVFNVYFSADTRGDSVALAWPYANICLACAILLLWPMAAMRERRGFLAWDAAAIILAAIPAMALAMWLSSASAANVFACLLFQIALLAAITGALLWSSAPAARSAGRELAVATVACALTLGVPLLIYLQMEFLGGSTAWGSIGPLVGITRVATGGGGEVVATVFYFLAGAGLMAFSATRKS